MKSLVFLVKRVFSQTNQIKVTKLPKKTKMQLIMCFSYQSKNQPEKGYSKANHPISDGKRWDTVK
jgi:hypothetical protein